MQFAGQVALVTGAGNGIGRCIAEALAREGATIVVADIDIARAQEAAARIGSSGGRAVWQRTDVSSAEQVGELFARVAAEFGQLDILVNNAGTTIRKPIVEFAEHEWDFVLDTNVKSLFLCVREAGKLMLPRKRGAVVNISSIHGLGGISKRLPYAASKTAVDSLTKTLACEWAWDGVRVNAIAPGYILTDGMKNTLAQGLLDQEDMLRRTPLARMGTPENIADAAVFLCSERASFITGVVLYVDGGYAAYNGPETAPSFRHSL